MNNVVLLRDNLIEFFEFLKLSDKKLFKQKYLLYLLITFYDLVKLL